MKIKQIKTIFFIAALCLPALIAVISPFGSQSAYAYKCADPNRPTDVYEYHEEDGQCWKVHYSQDKTIPSGSSVVAKAGSNGFTCPNGGSVISYGGRSDVCKAQCATGQDYHSDTNSCWKKDGYDGSGQVEPTYNNGTTLNQGEGNNGACTPGWTYIKPSGNNLGGCYQLDRNGSAICSKPDQVQKQVDDGLGNRRLVCVDSGVKHTVPLEKAQSADPTDAFSDNRAETVSSCKAKNLGYDESQHSCLDNVPTSIEDVPCSRLNGTDIAYTSKVRLATYNGRTSRVILAADPVNENKEKAKKQQAACEAGKSGEDCAAKYSTNIERQGCAVGKRQTELDKLCGTNQECRNGAQQCLNQYPTKEEASGCLIKVPGINKDEIGAVTDGRPSKTNFKCGEAETVIIDCKETGIGAIGSILKIGIGVLSALIGVSAVGGLAWASVQYAKAESNEASVKEARELIRNIVIGVALYGFMVAIINWLVPGGVIG